MAAGDRLQIVLAAKDEISSELKQVKAEMTSLGRTAATLQNRIEAGEQGLQNEYEQTRRALEKNRLKQIELGRAASKAKTEIRQMTSDGTVGMKRMDRATDGANRSMSRSKTAAATLTTGWGKMVGAVAVATGAIASLSGAFRFLSSSIEEAREQRKAAEQLSAVMRSMGRTEAPEAIMELVDQLTRMSGIEDDEILSSINLMLTFGEITGKTFNQAETAAVDLAAAFHMDLQSATVMVGKALNNPIGGLTSLMRVGVAFTEKQKEKIKTLMEEGELLKAQKIIMGELTRQVGGSAEAQADSIDKMRVAWKDLQQAIGEALMSSAPGWDLTATIRKATKWIEQNQGKIVEGLLEIAGGAMRVGETFLRMGAAVTFAYGQILLQMVPVLNVLGLLTTGQWGWGDSLQKSALGAVKASEGMWDMADAAADLADKTYAARDEAERFNTALDQIKNKKMRIEIRATIVDVQTTVQDAVDAANAAVRKANRRAENNVDNWALGGPVTAGQTGWVGEIGPELFVPTIGSPRVIGADGPEIRDFRQSGTVIPNHLLATVTLPKHAAVPAGYVGPPVTIGTINAGSDVDVEKAVLRATLRADRIARERR